MAWYSAYRDIAEFSLPLVEKLKAAQKLNGCYPGSLPGFQNKDLFPPEVQTWMNEQNYSLAWIWILDEILFLLACYSAEEDFYESQERLQRAKMLFGAFFDCLWD